jgi:glutathione S-transferase
VGRRLITIPISHYCEKARWALERAGVPYAEEPHVQGMHQLVARLAGGGHTVPVLVAPEGVFAESADIVDYADARAPAAAKLYPRHPRRREEVRRLEEYFDEELGPHGRRWMYFHVLDQFELMEPYNCVGVPNWERRGFRATFPLLRRYAHRRLDISPQTVADSDRRVGAVFYPVARRLGDGRTYLCGEAFTAADVTFAALAAAVLAPDRYGVPLPQPEVLPQEMASRVRELRQHPAGAFALRLYAEERRLSR